MLDAHLRAYTRFDWPTPPAVYCSRDYIIDSLEHVLLLRRDDDAHRTTTAPVRDLGLPHSFITVPDTTAFWRRLLALAGVLPREAPHVMVCAGRHILTWPVARLCLYTKTLHDGAHPPAPRWFARRLAPTSAAGYTNHNHHNNSDDDDDDSGAETESESITYF
jgi:hypothetical protein